MRRRVGAAVALAAVIVAALAGCQARPGAFTRSDAQADVTAWTSRAVAAVGDPAPTAQTKLNAFETCRTDHAYITTTFQWRTITNVDVAAAKQGAAMSAIEKAFESAGWRLTKATGLVTIAGPENSKRAGLITVQTAGGTQLSISVVSPCYT